MPQSLCEKGADPLRHVPKTNEIDLPPKGQIPFWIGSQLLEGTASSTSFDRGRIKAGILVLCLDH